MPCVITLLVASTVPVFLATMALEQAATVSYYACTDVHVHVCSWILIWVARTSSDYMHVMYLLDLVHCI